MEINLGEISLNVVNELIALKNYAKIKRLYYAKQKLQKMS